MEKVSEADLVKRVKAFILNDNYAGALAVVKGVDAGRIKNPPVLCLIGEVYMHEKQYEVAEEVFLRAYDRSPKNRKVLDLITSLYIEMGEYAEAEYYYKEFISVASRDLHRYILRYRLDKGKGERLSVLIDTLERLKDYEYIEEWAYELATLYEAAGEEKKCIHECDEIVLWFGHGEYVDKAIALKCKLTGEPLPRMSTVEMQLAGDTQDEEAQRALEEAKEAEMASRARFNGRTPKPAVTEFSEVVDVHVINPDNALESAGVDTGIDTDLITKAMETQTAQFKEQTNKNMFNTGMLFNAMNQADRELEHLKEDDLEDDDEDDEIIGDGDEAYAYAGESGDSASMSDGAASASGGAMTGAASADDDNTSASAASETDLLSEDLDDDDDDDFIDEIIPSTAFEKPSFLADIQELADEETLRLVQERKNGDRPKMPDFLKRGGDEDDFHSPDDALAELEAMLDENVEETPAVSQIRETVAGMQDAVSAVLDEPEDAGAADMEEAVADGAESGAGVKSGGTAEAREATAHVSMAEQEVVSAAANAWEQEAFSGTANVTEPSDVPTTANVTELESVPSAADVDELEDVSATANISDPANGPDADDVAESEAASIFAGDAAEDAEVEMDEALESMTEDQDEVILEQAVFGGLPSTNMREADLDDEDDEILDEEEAEELLSSEDEAFLEELFSAGDEGEDDDEVMDENIPIPQTVKDIFATVPDVKNVHKQLAMTFTQFETSGSDYDVLAAYDINFVVLSDDNGMKSQIAIGIAKALNTYGICDKNKIVRAKASELNRSDFSVIFPKISGGCLIVEGADELSDASVAVIEKEVSKDNQDVAIVLESRQDALKAFWKKHRTLRGRFLNVINVSKYNETELVTLAKGYIEKRGYELSPEAAIILRNYFKKHLQKNDVVGYETVMNVVDAGIENLDKRNMKNLYMTVLDNKYEEAHMLRLLPEDFKLLQ